MANTAAFLKQFVGASYPWVHLDIAPRMTTFPDEFLSKGTAGAPIRLLVKLLQGENLFLKKSSMSHFLPRDEMKRIESELQSAVAEYLAASQALKNERDELEEEMVLALEKRKMADVKKKLHA